MTFDDYRPLIAELEKIGLPLLTPVITAAATGVAGPLGLAAPYVLDGIIKMVNGALGISEDSTPTQTAAVIAADPDAAASKLAAVQEDHSYLLAATKQADDTMVTSQAQQTALLAIDASAQSKMQRWWRPAIGWGLGGLMMLSFGLPFAIWAASIFGLVLPPPPVLPDQGLYILGALLGVTVAARSADKATNASAVKSVMAPVAKKPLK